MISVIKKFKSKYIGDIFYISTIINVDSEIKRIKFKSKNKLNEFVNDMNNETYWMIKKIEKIREFDFKYNENIIHKPLFFYNNDICQKQIVDETNKIEFSFLKKDKSLINVIYKR